MNCHPVPRSFCRWPVLSLLLVGTLLAQGTVPTFRKVTAGHSYTLVGHDPARGGSITIPTVVVPVSLTFGQSERMDASGDVFQLLHSPLFQPFSFSVGSDMQFADAILRATFSKASSWHTLLGAPEVMPPVHITVPVSDGYTLTSKKSGRSVAVADLEFVQRELFKRIPKQPGTLVIAVTHNTTYYAEGDATICCLWGTHGYDAATGNSFVLASYLSDAPSIVEDQDVQPLTEQLAEFLYDPMHNPLAREEEKSKSGNEFPAWMRPAAMRPGDQGRCGGTRIATPYFQLEPTDTNRKNNFPSSAPFAAQAHGATYHVQNVALLRWYLGGSESLGSANSFPDTQVLREPAQPCPARNGEDQARSVKPAGTPTPRKGGNNGHQLIGYWVGEGEGDSAFPLSEVPAQWDVVIVAFAVPVANAPEGTLRFRKPLPFDNAQFKRDVVRLKSQGKKVLISLGGGGQYFTLRDAKSIPTFVSCVEQIVKEYGFDGIDIDFESPSLVIDPGDTDFRHPKTPSIANLISGLRQLRSKFGPSFMISLVPEGTQIPAGHVTYGGQFGSYLPLAYGIRDILSFMDVQDYNTPPLQGLDGEIYQARNVDYHAAVTELVLQGFTVGNKAHGIFPALPARQVAVGFLTGETTPPIAAAAMDYIIWGQKPSNATYQLRQTGGYPNMIGAMFWTIDDDRLEHFRFSNVVGPELHGDGYRTTAARRP